MSSTDLSASDEPINSAVSARRFVNDAIRDDARRFKDDPTLVFQFHCECGDVRCRRLVRLTMAEYEAAEPGLVRGRHSEAARSESARLPDEAEERGHEAIDAARAARARSRTLLGLIAKS
jgi:hypothetical protein